VYLSVSLFFTAFLPGDTAASVSRSVLLWSRTVASGLPQSGSRGWLFADINSLFLGTAHAHTTCPVYVRKCYLRPHVQMGSGIPPPLPGCCPKGTRGSFPGNMLLTVQFRMVKCVRSFTAVHKNRFYGMVINTVAVECSPLYYYYYYYLLPMKLS
jgi:hypothetical protein